jgi:hypothetical protein
MGKENFRRNRHAVNLYMNLVVRIRKSSIMQLNIGITLSFGTVLALKRHSLQDN